jgi:succinylglutamate desuccinylase
MRVLVFGGTHGNEWTGVQVVERYAETLKKEFKTLDLHFVFANPEAFKLNKRFKDEDLNRAFQFLNEKREGSFEHQRAKELKQLIEERPCFVVDLHTTTSNMGLTVIVSHYNQFNLGLASQLSHELPDCRLIGSPDPDRKYLASQSDKGLMIEVGPISNGIIEPKTLEGTLKILRSILTHLETNNLPQKGEVTLYEEIEDVTYPCDENGTLQAYIHKDFQGKDFQAIKGNYTPFQTFSGKEIQHQTPETLYPIFINEAAYYPKRLAFTLCRKVSRPF